MTTFKVFDNLGEDYGEYETQEAARDAILDLIQMDLEDDGYVRRQYEIKEEV